MTTYDQPRETPDWMPRAARCRKCGSDDWHADCDGLTIPDHIELGAN